MYFQHANYPSILILGITARIDELCKKAFVPSSIKSMLLFTISLLGTILPLKLVLSRVSIPRTEKYDLYSLLSQNKIYSIFSNDKMR